MHLEVQLPVKAGMVSEWWIMESSSPLVPWDSEPTANLWLGVDLSDKAKWLYDGYYYTSPSTYVPYTVNAFWRNPENYVVRSFLANPTSKAAQNMAYVMLDTAVRNQEAEGHWKTYPQSQWLADDYGSLMAFTIRGLIPEWPSCCLMAAKSIMRVNFVNRPKGTPCICAITPVSITT